LFTDAGLPLEVARNLVGYLMVRASLGEQIGPPELDAAQPQATLHVYDHPGPVWTARADLRTRIATFLNTP
ncbi:MAG TPA: hypothetical protein VHA75_05910, partial [Rugosimonospora sp.]|nr:hypothetical protein [Rugosimonospora sp.]